MMTSTRTAARTPAEAFDDGAAAADSFAADWGNWAAGYGDPLDPTPESEPSTPRAPYPGKLGRAWRDGWDDYMLNHAPQPPSAPRRPY